MIDRGHVGTMALCWAGLVLMRAAGCAAPGGAWRAETVAVVE